MILQNRNEIFKWLKCLQIDVQRYHVCFKKKPTRGSHESVLLNWLFLQFVFN
jgi:hypothetical protein